MGKFLKIFFFGFCILLQAQHRNFILKDQTSGKESVKKDSLSAVKFLDSLAENNYYFTKIISVKKTGNDTEILYDKGQNYNQAQVSLPNDLAKKLHTEEHFFTKNLDSLRKEINKKYTDEGFSFNRVKTKFHGFENGIPKVEISVAENGQRKIDGFVLKGYEKVPKRFVKNLEKEYSGKIYREKNLLSIARELQNHPFVTLERPPQTLFTKDSTNIYLFLQKKKTNSFDGILGFGNDQDKKFALNGTVDLNFRNIFNGFESISIYWQRAANRGQTFDIQSDIPYLAGTNLGLNLNARIFRQDSTYANAKFLPSLYFHLNSRQKMGIRGTFERSTVLDSLYTAGTDFTKSGVGIWYQYTEPAEVELFRFTTLLNLSADFIKTNYENSEAKQMQYFVAAERNFHLSGNHYINAKVESAMLQSDLPLYSNELFRIGGWNSFRGFEEASLFADLYYFGGAEYRYLINSQAFFDVFGQLGEIRNKNLDNSSKLYSAGVGFNFFLPIGLMTFQISSGNEFGKPVRFGDTKIHWGILSRF